MKRSHRWNTFQICPHWDSNSGGSDLRTNALPVRPWRHSETCLIKLYLYNNVKPTVCKQCNNNLTCSACQMIRTESIIFKLIKYHTPTSCLYSHITSNTSCNLSVIMQDKSSVKEFTNRSQLFREISHHTMILATDADTWSQIKFSIKWSPNISPFKKGRHSLATTLE